MAKVSIVLPAKDCGDFLAESLNSLKKQDYSDFECVIVYGKSNDRTANVIDHFTSIDKRFRVIHGVGSGLAADLNLGIIQSDSDYILRLDADDVAKENRLTNQLKYLTFGYDIVGSNIEYFGNFHYTKSDYPLTLDAIKFYALFRNPFAHPSIGFRRKLNLLYNTEYDGVEDYELWVRCLNDPCINAINIKEALTKYRIHKYQSTKQSDNSKILELRGQLSKNMCQHMEIPIESQNLFIALSKQKILSFEGILEITNLLNKSHNINKEDRLRIFKEIILSTDRLNIKQANLLLDLLRNNSPSFFYSTRSFIILLFSSGPLSLFARTMRITWG